MHILIVEAPFYTHIADMQRDGVTEALKAAGATYDVITVPGAALLSHTYISVA